jgi:hypothetical protein
VNRNSSDNSGGRKDQPVFVPLFFHVFRSCMNKMWSKPIPEVRKAPVLCEDLKLCKINQSRNDKHLRHNALPVQEPWTAHLL